MISVCPTITAGNPDMYRQQMLRVQSFAKRLHVDLMDGAFAPTRSVSPDQVWWPGNIWTDLHVMYENPFIFTDVFVALGPALVIVHAEARGDFVSFADTLHSHGIRVGVALLPQTSPKAIFPAIEMIDHVLIFSGNLGHQGGSTADLKLTGKIDELKRLKPTLEIGWDGGVNSENAPQLVRAGVEVLNVGGFIHHADSPLLAYQQIVDRL